MMIRGFLFDMDGVLFDSMPNHTRAWYQTMQEWHVPCTEAEFYLHEGRTGRGTTHLLFERTFGRPATEEECRAVYARKTECFNALPLALPMVGAFELLATLKAQGYRLGVVTGSAQASLLGRLESAFPGIFSPEHIVSAHDVQHGKPHPEPYLKGLQKLNLSASECVVVENAPMGVASAKAAGLYTVTLNTGPLPDILFEELHTDQLYLSMEAFRRDWNQFRAELTQP